MVRDALARAALQRQQQALRTSSRRAYLSTWDGRSAVATHRGTTVFDNLQALDASVTGTRYVAANVGGLSAARQRRLGGTAWTADVDLSWRLRRYDGASAHTVMVFTFVRRGKTAYVAGINAASGNREPVWLLSHLTVRRSSHTLAAATSAGQAARLDRLLRLAVTDVRRVVATWHGSLVAYEPGTTADFETVLGASSGTYDSIAAVTSTVDGSTSRKAPVAIVINPAAFDGLGPVAAHVVITHESTHAATGAATVTLPLWVAEGFADYVAVGAVDVPLSVSAGALIRDIHRHGLPRSLPADDKFAATGKRLEVYYEQAWLSARVIAKEYGEARLLAFYERVVAQPDSVRAALRTELGTTIARLTRQWRTYLRTVAGAA